MANDKVITGAIAIVKVNGVAVGKMKGIRVNENVTRGDVRGIGQLTPLERPALSWSGTLSCDFYNIDLKMSQLPQGIFRSVQTLQEFVNSLVLQEEGISVDIYRKVPTGGQTAPLILSEETPYCTVRGVLLDAESFDINEGQISGHNQSFSYIYPIIFPNS